MITADEKFQKRRIRGAYIGTVVSIALVLVMLGIQCLIIGYTQKVSDYVKENIGFTIVIKDKIMENDILNLKAMLDTNRYVKSTTYISKKQAAQELQKDLGSDFIDFLGYNPLLPSVEVHLNAEYTHNDSIMRFEKWIESRHMVKEVYYEKDLISFINDNVKKMSIILLGFGGFMLLIAISLISGTMRLIIYSKRFIINSMQLVGAKPSFIRRPLVLSACMQGLSAAILANIILAAILYYIHKHIPEIVGLEDKYMFIFITSIILCIGVIFTLLSATFAINKYIKMRNSDSVYR